MSQPMSSVTPGRAPLTSERAPLSAEAASASSANADRPDGSVRAGRIEQGHVSQQATPHADGEITIDTQNLDMELVDIQDADVRSGEKADVREQLRAAAEGLWDEEIEWVDDGETRTRSEDDSSLIEDDSYLIEDDDYDDDFDDDFDDDLDDDEDDLDDDEDDDDEDDDDDDFDDEDDDEDLDDDDDDEDFDDWDDDDDVDDWD